MIDRYQYTYDRASNVTLTTEANGDTVLWSYDTLYRLTGDVRTGANSYDKQFTYDPVANRLVENANGVRTTSTYDVANQLSSSVSGSGTTQYTFDNSGNQQIVQAPSGALTTSTWDYENQNIRVLPATGGSVDMQFNAANRRVAKTSALTDSVFLWSSVTDNIIQDLNPAGSGLVANSFLPGTYGELIKQDDGQSSFFLFDRRGSTMATASAAQVIADTFRFDAYGNVVARTGSSLTPYQFQGAWGYFLDVELANLYTRRRTYSPRNGRWLSKDPIRFINGINIYFAYFIPGQGDPSGLWVDLGQSIWQSDLESDNFKDLIKQVAPRLQARNMVCIRPIRPEDNQIELAMRNAWEKKDPAICGQYDLGNLTDSWENGGLFMANVGDNGSDNGYISAASAFYDDDNNIVHPYRTGANLVEALREASHSGGTPLGQLIVIGHSWFSERSIGSLNNDDDNAGHFGLNDLGPIVVWPTFDDATDRRFSPLCWFRTDANVRFVGCNTGPFASQFAKEVLRIDATSFGTTKPTWANGNGQLGWGQEDRPNFSNGDPLANSPAEYHGSPNWRNYNGRH